MIKHRFFFFLISFLLFSFVAKSQKSVSDSSIFIPSLSIHYSYHLASGDIGKTYGNNHAVGTDFTVKLKNQFVLGLGFEYYFSEDVKNEDSYFANIKTEKGFVIDGNGQYAEMFLYERGFNIQLFTGYQFDFWSKNPNSGPFVQAGVGFMQYRTQIKNTENTAPQVQGEYVKMYDRLSNGLSTTQYFGYRYMGSRNLWNFYIGVELTQGWTKNRRTYNADLPESESLNHFDFLTAIKLGWIIPFYKKTPQDYYYY